MSDKLPSRAKMIGMMVEDNLVENYCHFLFPRADPEWLTCFNNVFSYSIL